MAHSCPDCGYTCHCGGDIDDCCLQFEPLWQQHLVSDGSRQRWREQRLCLSEVMTIVVSFHQSGYRTFKDYFLRYVQPHLRWAFPQLVSYTRFVELMAQALGLSVPISKLARGAARAWPLLIPRFCPSVIPNGQGATKCLRA